MELTTVILILIGIYAVLHGVFKFLRDTLSFRAFNKNWKTIFSGIKNVKVISWLDPKVSWMNKHDWFPKSKVLTWLFSNPLVAFTDGWHFLELLINSIPYIIFAISLQSFWWMSPIFYVVAITIFHLLFTYTNKRIK